MAAAEEQFLGLSAWVLRNKVATGSWRAARDHAGEQPFQAGLLLQMIAHALRAYAGARAADLKFLRPWQRFGEARQIEKRHWNHSVTSAQSLLRRITNFGKPGR
jgi:hypothetical protein